MICTIVIRTKTLLYADISSDKERFTKGRSYAFKKYLKIFEKQFKMLTGL